MSRSPVIPTSVELIHPKRSKAFHREPWVYDEKYDGWRIAAIKDGRDVRLISRRTLGKPATEVFARQP